MISARPLARIWLISVMWLAACTHLDPQAEWQIISTEGELTARHEASFVEHEGTFYLLGGRRVNPVEAFDPDSRQWTQKSLTPLELHHFQAVSLGNAIYIVGAMTGGYPNETPVDRVIKYYPAEDRFEFTHEIPESRRRGGAGAVVYNNKIYVVGGITDGHRGGYRPWLDEYDPASGQWRTLPDAPNSRDHFQAVAIGGKLYAFAGRRSSQATGDTINLVTQHGNIFDFDSGQWLPVTENLAIPTPRAGNMAIAWNDNIIVVGGESGEQVAAHNEVEVYDTKTDSWQQWPSLNIGRHGSGLAIHDGYLYTVSGSGKRGGEPELSSVERIKLPERNSSTLATPPNTLASNSTPIHQRWHTLTLPFSGPMTVENAASNPFTDYRLTVTFEHADTSYSVRGFYAADGNAANTGADSGKLWQARFTPDQEGLWRYTAELRLGKDIAINDDLYAGERIPLAESTGHFLVVPSDKSGPDFRARGRLISDQGYFRFAMSNQSANQGSDQNPDQKREQLGDYWLKGGTNSPENFLGYVEFDGTYVAATSAREGEAARDNNMHAYEPHITDWQLGDPIWSSNENANKSRGKGIVGAVNYLGSKGMNAAYFLTLNIDGDGNDVWPFMSPTDFERFDVSKLDQWEIVFQHMQSKGILLHVVTQETENERMLDDGDTGRLRKLYYRELIARFGHHLGLIWNLGEENGPADFSPHAQTDQQRKAMADYLTAQDPYGHPVLIHSHSEAESKHHILGPLLGLETLDGASFQVDERERVNAEIAEWRKRSKEAGQEWLITMDEIGKWHTGATPDADNPNHDSLRQHALWGAILGGAAGVEWYFGARYPANDLSSEDWRLRDRLWTLTRIALDFFDDRPYWHYSPCNELIASKTIRWNGYCAGWSEQEYVIYSPADASRVFDSSGLDSSYHIQWFDPINGGELQQGSLASIQSGAAIQPLGEPPHNTEQDWVILLTRR